MKLIRFDAIKKPDENLLDAQLKDENIISLTRKRKRSCSVYLGPDPEGGG